MNDETDPVLPVQTTGDGSRPPLPAMPAPKRSVTRSVAVRVRGPFLPDHHGERHGLKPGES